MKQCNSCKKTFPDEAFARGAAKCRDCKKAYMKEWRQQRSEHLKAYNRAYKDEHRESLKRYRAEYQKRRGAQLNKAWGQRNQARRNEAARRRTHANPVRHREEARRRRAANLFRYRLYSRENGARRKASRANVTVQPVNYLAILERDGYICHICGQAVSPENVSFDHVIPISKGGSHSDNNIRIAHLSCNIRKGAKLWTVPSSQEASKQSQ